MVEQYFKNTYWNWTRYIFEINVSGIKSSIKKLKTDKKEMRRKEWRRRENSRILAVGIPWTLKLYERAYSWVRAAISITGNTVQLHNEVVVMVISPINLIAQHGDSYTYMYTYVCDTELRSNKRAAENRCKSYDKSQLFPPGEMHKCRYILNAE